MKHTPTPWIFREQGDANQFCILTKDGGGWVLGLLHNGEPLHAQQEANFRFILRACNAHDELVAALETVTELLEGFREHPIDQDLDDDEAPIIAPALDAALAAIAKAKGEA